MPLEIKSPWRSKAPGDQKPWRSKAPEIKSPEIKCPWRSKAPEIKSPGIICPWRSNAPKWLEDQRPLEIKGPRSKVREIKCPPMTLRSNFRDQSSGDQNSGDHLPINQIYHNMFQNVKHKIARKIPKILKFQSSKIPNIQKLSIKNS